MEKLIVQDDLGFDFDKAKKYIETYSSSTESGSAILDIYGQILCESDFNKKLCHLCRKINRKDKHQSCSKTNLLYGCYQAEKLGGKYIFFCPLGLCHWASPISVNGIMKGAVIGGPALIMEPEDFLIDDILRKNEIDNIYLNELKHFISEMPVTSTERVNSLSELLYLVTNQISCAQPLIYEDDREVLEQQAKISEYIHLFKTMGGSENNTPGYPIEKERELLTLISLGDKAGSQKVLNEIFGHIFFSSGGDFKVIKARVLELVVLLSRAALEGGADIEQIFGLNYNYLSEIHEFTSIEDLTFWLSKIMIRFTDCVFNLVDVKHIDVIIRAINYIKQNYMKKITLEDVASQVFLSPSYFSKVFKEEMKYNFNTYLNHVRIEMSKKILSNDAIALIDVPSMVGYEDQSYFSKVFKKMCGVSPGKFRETRGKAG